MVPSRIYPLYLLAILYAENGDYKQSYKIATDLINTNAKVESRAVREIKNEMKQLKKRINLEQNYELEDK